MDHGEIQPIDVLLVEDSPSDTEITIAGLEIAKLRNHLSTVEDGVQAMQFLRQQGPYAKAPRPDLILLDLNLPRKDGRHVLAEIKADPNLMTIPAAVLTASHADRDILKSSQLQATCYLNKPVDFDRLVEVVRCIDSFWIMVVTLPPAANPAPTIRAAQC
jgi:two-component system response regulator